jgi:hypothetical protein
MTRQPDLAHISPQILDLIHRRNILSSEDPVLYDTLFHELLEIFDPLDGLQCLNLKRLHDIRWDILRISSFKPKIIDAARKDALQSLLQSIAYHGTPCVSGSDGSGKDAAAFFENPGVKKIVAAKLATYELDQLSINAQAFLLRLGSLETIEKMLASLEARAYVLLEQIEIHHERRQRQHNLHMEVMHSRRLDAPSDRQ